MTSPCLTHACAACCHDTEMPITEEDARRLEALGHDRASFSLLSDDGTLRLANRDGACVFLKDERCSVYADRPTGCRIYPFVMTPEGRVVRDHDCPYRTEFPMENGTRARLLRIVSVVQREASRR